MLFAVAALSLCGNCHAQIVREYLKTPMARSAGQVNPGEEAPGAVLQRSSGTRFDIKVGAGELQLAWGGRKLNLEIYVGSRHNGRSYVWQEDGFLYEAPVGYYTAKQAWDMAPGYFSDTKPDVWRPITRECLFCHAGQAQFVPGTLNRVANQESLGGIGCERCHGGGEAHARAPSRNNIINPARLPATARDSVCEQCHLAGRARVAYAGKQLADFRPGQNFSDTVQVFLDNSPPGVSVTAHSEALARSKCKLAAGDRLWCGTCHSPHQQTASFRERCLACHNSPHDQGDCIACHMPKARAFDGGHTAFTDHSIRPRPIHAVQRAAADLVPFYAKPLNSLAEQRALGTAYADQGWYERAWPLLRNVVAQAPDPVSLTEAGWILQRSGLPAKAAELYEAALAKDPHQLPALINLAGLRLERGDRERAIDLLRRALAMNPYQPGVRDKLDRLLH